MTTEQFDVLIHSIRKIIFLHTAILICAVCVTSCKVETEILKVRKEIADIKDREK